MCTVHPQHFSFSFVLTEIVSLPQWWSGLPLWTPGEFRSREESSFTSMLCCGLLTNNFYVGCSLDFLLSIYLTCVGARVFISGILDGHSMLHTNNINCHFSSFILQDGTIALPDHISLFVQLTGQVHRLTLYTCCLWLQFFQPFHWELYTETELLEKTNKQKNQYMKFK